MRVAVVGATGRMGEAVLRLAKARGISVVCGVGSHVPAMGEGTNSQAAPAKYRMSAIAAAAPDVIIDFSTPAALVETCLLCKETGIALVSGTTGLGRDESNALDEAARFSAVLWEPNMSVGAFVLSEIVEICALRLAGFEAEIVEAHHHAKADAPSGTALRLGQAIQRGNGDGEQREFVYGRRGTGGARHPGEVGIHALRGGDTVGDHTVYFFGDGERLELVHRATSRDVFAAGALRCAEWIVGRPSGRYGLRDVLSRQA